MRVDLGKDKKTGADRWAEIIDDVEEMPARIRTKVRSVITMELGPDGQHKAKLDGGLADHMKYALIAAVTKAWSFEQPITPETVADLPLSAYDKLSAATEPHMAAVNFSQPETDGESSSA